MVVALGRWIALDFHQKTDCQVTGVSGSSGGTACTTTGAGGRGKSGATRCGKSGKVSIGTSLPGTNGFVHFCGDF